MVTRFRHDARVACWVLPARIPIGLTLPCTASLLSASTPCVPRRSQFEACLRQEGVRGKLKSCLVFGPDTFADLRRLLLRDSEPGAGQQGYPALERFCRVRPMMGRRSCTVDMGACRHVCRAAAGTWARCKAVVLQCTRATCAIWSVVCIAAAPLPLLPLRVPHAAYLLRCMPRC